MPTINPTGRVDIVASRLFERAVAAHPNPLVQFMGSMLMPEVESAFHDLLGPRTTAGKLAKKGIDRIQQRMTEQLHGAGYREPVQRVQPIQGQRVKAKAKGPVKGKATATVNGKRAKFRPTKPGEYRGRVIDVDAEVIG